MYICENCFDSNLISKHIKEKGNKTRADFICNSCENRSRFRIDRENFKKTIRSIIMKHYEHDSDHGLVSSASMMAREEDDDISMYIPQRMTYNLIDLCWELFEIDDNQKFYDLLVENRSYDYFEFPYNIYDETWMNLGRDWDVTSLIELNWDEFCKNVKHKARYFDHSQFNRINELSKLKETFSTLSKKVSISLYRARKVNEKEKLKRIQVNPEKELGIATPEKSGHNRFSPSGIAYVYLSEDDETILKEIRVKNRDRVAIAKFSINDLNLVDLRKENIEIISKDIFHDKCTAQLLCSANTILDFLYDITREVKKEDNHLEYIPTQIVSEYIWTLGYDGFIFDSSLCDGTNYVLFKAEYKFIDYQIKKLRNKSIILDLYSNLKKILNVR